MQHEREAMIRKSRHILSSLFALLILFGSALAGDIIRLWPVEINGKWGYINERGKLVIEAQFDSATSFARGFAQVRMGDEWGCVNSQGVRVPIEFDYVGCDSPLPVRKDGRWAVWTNYYADHYHLRDTLVQMAEYDSIGEFYAQQTVVRHQGKYGVVEWKVESGEMQVVIPPTYDVIARPEYNPGFAPLMEHGIREVYLAKRDGRWGLITGKDSVLISLNYDSLITGTQSQYVAVKVADKWGFADLSGTMRIEPQFEATRGFERSFSLGRGSWWGFGTPAAAVSRDGKWGFIDTTGHEIVPLQYQNVGRIGRARIAVQADNKWGYLDSTGTLVIPMKYDSGGTLNIWGPVKVGNKFGFISEKGKWMVSPELDAVEEFELPMTSYIVRKQGKYAFVIPRGKPIVGWYDEVTPFYAGYARVRQNGHWRYVGTDGSVLWPTPSR